MIFTHKHVQASQSSATSSTFHPLPFLAQGSSNGPDQYGPGGLQARTWPARPTSSSPPEKIANDLMRERGGHPLLQPRAKFPHGRPAALRQPLRPALFLPYWRPLARNGPQAHAPPRHVLRRATSYQPIQEQESVPIAPRPGSRSPAEYERWFERYAAGLLSGRWRLGQTIHAGGGD
jgi:hypothetical protein